MTYTVQSGDSLSEISQKFYGDFSQVAAIAAANHISNVDVIFPGQVLQLPDAPMVKGQVHAGGGNIWSSVLLVALAVGTYFYYNNKGK